jgi:hypothetical protein
MVRKGSSVRVRCWAYTNRLLMGGFYLERWRRAGRGGNSGGNRRRYDAASRLSIAARLGSGTMP